MKTREEIIKAARQWFGTGNEFSRIVDNFDEKCVKIPCKVIMKQAILHLCSTNNYIINSTITMEDGILKPEQWLNIYY